MTGARELNKRPVTGGRPETLDGFMNVRNSRNRSLAKKPNTAAYGLNRPKINVTGRIVKATEPLAADEAMRPKTGKVGGGGPPSKAAFSKSITTQMNTNAHHRKLMDQQGKFDCLES